MAETGPHRQTANLYRGRTSLPHARYFLTFCTVNRKSDLTQLPTTDLFSAMENLENAGDLQNFCATVMPDHVHWLFRLGERLSLGRVAARWKNSTRKLLAAHGLEWQRDFFERHVRQDERLEPYGFYVFLNPYCKGLISVDECWPHWRMWRPEIFEFSEKMRNGGLPQREWLEQIQERPWVAEKRAQQVCAPTTKPRT